MKLSTVVISLFILILPLSNMAYDQNEKPELADKYLGQTPPSLTTNHFATLCENKYLTLTTLAA
ncbi:hypothetical protein C1E24_18455 [Pseudoalteromonas phenolica]|uniref:Uncharacterized protein n=1 Tax=Pseudoalteromonas phenolica TaxID=161398 RepID=A0A5R9PYV7_9GAMM|nr:hypothetical protein [Pseudoalteromonas phenolica]TLX45572.1 hypothetical protein C1E24_18455 [Pseudoalteromonas phenolica]